MLRCLELWAQQQHTSVKTFRIALLTGNSNSGIQASSKPLNPPKMGRIYWREMLFRTYWAAALNLMRHQRWQAGCVRAFSPPANLLAFAASLRGLLEASQDAFYSLRQVPHLLADNQQAIEAALKSSGHQFGISKDLEDRLIHFIYGRRVGKGEQDMTPESHIALEPKEYRNAIGLPEDNRENFKELYDYLCGVCHPHLQSQRSNNRKKPGGGFGRCGSRNGTRSHKCDTLVPNPSSSK